MSDALNLEIKITLPNKKELVFGDGQTLNQWVENFLQQWRWLENTPARRTWERLQGILQNTRNHISNWERNPKNEQTFNDAKAVFSSAIGQAYNEMKGVLWDEASLTAISDARKINDTMAAGLLTSLTGGEVYFGNPASESYFSGLIKGFLFKNDINWTATAHREALQTLETQARDCLIKQEERLKQLESENTRLNKAHQETLLAKEKALGDLTTSKEQALDGLRTAKEKAFADLVTDYDNKFQAIKKLYTDELAMRAPVKYWEESHSRHVKLSLWFAILSIVVLASSMWGLTELIHWAFGSLGKDENPKHWEVGVVVVSTFFAVWVIRIIIRLFLSHQHLATDAAQKVTMVQTYLALGQEEGGVSKEDRTIILQQLFKSAADGIVKEDGTPPGWMEWLSRSKQG